MNEMHEDVGACLVDHSQFVRMDLNFVDVDDGSSDVTQDAISTEVNAALLFIKNITIDWWNLFLVVIFTKLICCPVSLHLHWL